MTEDVPPLVVTVTASGAEYLTFAPPATGWALYVTPDEDRRIFVRFGFAAAEAGAKIVVREAYLSFRGSFGPRAVRDLPWARFETAVNQPRYYAEVTHRLPAVNAVMTPFPWQESAAWWFHKPEPRRAPRLKLTVPAGRPKPDAFYEQVAERFTYLATISKRPAQDLAEANDIGVTTVHGWVKEARRRGLLPSGERARRAP